MFTALYLRVYERASAEERAEGASWYPRAREAISAMARATRRERLVACGVVAALSPKNTWTGNLTMAHRLLGGARRAGHTRLQERKARAIMRGADPFEILSGAKESAFCAALAGDDSAVVVDRWMFRIVGVARERGALWPTPRRYTDCADAVREGARIVGLAPATFQAIVWVRARVEARA